MLFSAMFFSCTSADKATDPEKKPVKDVAKADAGDNPFFSTYDTPFGVPPFDKIKDEHYLPAFKKGIEEQKEEIAAIIDNKEAPTFENTIEALENTGGLLDKVQAVFGAMRASNTNDTIQKVAQEVFPLLSKHGDDIMLNADLFKRIKSVWEQKDKLNLTEEQQMLLKKSYQAFARGGANLSPEKQEEFRKINEELSLLSLKFSDNILNENNKFEMVLDKKEDLKGLPESVINAAALTAKERGHEGKWVFTLHKPSLIPFLQYSDKRELREKMLKGYINRGDNNNEYDNKELIKKIVTLRAKRAELLGFKNHASFVLDKNMAKTPENVYQLLNKVWKPALAMAKKEAKELQALIDKEGGNFKLEAWDWWYYTEKLKKARYDLDDNLIRPYFKLENVIDGAFYVAEKLFKIKFVPRTDIPTYHKDAKVFEVQNLDGSHVGILYADYFPRASKRGGAWMNNLREQSMKDGKNIAPVVTNNGNFTKPTADKPSLLSFEEVSTLFHEFGHALHGLLTKCRYESTSGTNVALDFVELPSQIMENWASEPEVLKVYAKHYKTGEVIPQELLDKMKKAGLFNMGFTTVEYMAACFLDLDWHMVTEKDPAKIDVNKFETESLNKIGLIPEIVVRYRSTYFNHIFSSMYSAGYYSYIWAEVLDADAFAAFKETSIFDDKTAEAFKTTVLEKGGSVEPMELYKRFRGKEPGIEPLLKKRGLL
jgi:peptidyl-dipeptidase Dcp